MRSEIQTADHRHFQNLALPPGFRSADAHGSNTKTFKENNFLYYQSTFISRFFNFKFKFHHFKSIFLRISKAS